MQTINLNLSDEAIDGLFNCDPRIQECYHVTFYARFCVLNKPDDQYVLELSENGRVPPIVGDWEQTWTMTFGTESVAEATKEALEKRGFIVEPVSISIPLKAT